MAFLEAEWKIEFGLDEIIKFFYEKCNFKEKEEAISHALVLLCMRIHIEHPWERSTTDMSDIGYEKMKTVMRATHALKTNTEEKKKIAA